jgi:predicted NAD/FAD-binding protein
MSRRRIAVIGSGVSGVTAAYLLHERADVTLYEADSRLGGHVHTHALLDDDGRMVSVDTGFIVHNRRTYPNLIRLFRQLGIDTQLTEMSMSVRCEQCGLQYAGGRGVGGLFPGGHNLANLRYLRMLAEVPRFHRQARALVADDGAADDAAADLSLGEFLARARFSRYFRDHFATPLVAAVWSCSAADAMRYPATYLFAFLANHGMLSVAGSPRWRTVVGGAALYVERATKQLNAVHAATPVRSVRRAGSGVLIRDDSDTVAQFDAAVIAAHADDALRLLSDASALHRAVLGAFRYSTNRTLLHRDTGVLPTAPSARSSWNYRMPRCQSPTGAVQVSYDLNRLQRLQSRTPYLVTLNAPSRDDAETASPCSLSTSGATVDAGRIVAEMVYRHPVYTQAAIRAQRRLPELNDGVLAFAGAYHGWGFHEDGCRSGVLAAESLGGGW